MKRFLLASLILPLSVFVVSRPISLTAFQSPVETPTAQSSPLATPGPADGGVPTLAEVTIPPLLWIVAGFVLGAALVLLVRRTSPHDR